MAASTIPDRTMWKARPMAWVAEEQAVEMLRVGPVIFWSMEMLLAPAEAMVRTTVSGWTRASRAESLMVSVSSAWRPPQAQPTMMAIFSGAWWLVNRDSRAAWRAATMANWVVRSVA